MSKSIGKSKQDFLPLNNIIKALAKCTTQIRFKQIVGSIRLLYNHYFGLKSLVEGNINSIEDLRNALSNYYSNKVERQAKKRSQTKKITRKSKAAKKVSQKKRGGILIDYY